MKRLLYCSLSVNILLVGFFVGKRLYYHQSGQTSGDKKPFADLWNDNRLTVLRPLPIDTSHIVFIGDSQTEGFLVNEIFGTQVRNRGITSNTSTHVLSRIDGILQNHPKRMIFTIGINDLRENKSATDVMTNIKNIVARSRAMSPKTDIVFNAVFPTRGDYFMLMQPINALNEQLSQFCQQEKIAFIDMYHPLLRDKQLDSAFTFDGLHLNGNGYAVWASIISPYTH